MGSAWDNLTKTFETAKQRRQNTSFGERLAGGIRKGFLTPKDDASSGTMWDSVLEAYQTPKSRPEANQSTVGKVEEKVIIEKLKARGMPEHVATAFAWNMKDESGLDSGINEIEPLVEGSRGGFGLYQLTGPRRRQYEQYASQKGKEYADVDTQLDFLMHELQTTEKRAAQSIYGSQTTGTAADAIVRKFLRPHESHRERRSANYLKRDAGGYTPVPAQKITSWNDLL